jgi:hypothetical protein
MIRHLRYLRLVIKHKLGVLIGGRRYGVPLINLVLHDWDKFLPDMWLAYVNRSFPQQSPPSQDAKQAFAKAWEKHWRRNRHHWQHWMLVGPTQYGLHTGASVCVAMPEDDAREMVADWYGAGWAYEGETNPIGWYKKNRKKIHLHPDTRRFVEELIGYEAT